jgi:predicted transcriptional regulator
MSIAAVSPMADRHEERAILISLRPHFAAGVIAGEKTFELRRTRPIGATPGMAVILYATAPVKGIVGLCRLGQVFDGTRESIWRMAGQESLLTRREFDRYFIGAERVVALRLKSPLRSPKPLSLASMRHEWPGFHPPRTFRYVDLRGLNGQRAPSLSPVRSEGSLPVLRVS